MNNKYLGAKNRGEISLDRRQIEGANYTKALAVGFANFEESCIIF